MGCGSGPGAERLIKFKYNDNTYTMNTLLNMIAEKPHVLRNGREAKYPVEIPLELSEEAKKDCDEYLKAFDTLLTAKAEFEKAKKAFKSTVGGESLLNAMIPQKGPLPVDEVIDKEDVEELKKLVSEAIGDNKIVETECSVQGYSIGMIVMKLENPILLRTVEEVTYKNYVWSKYDYNTHYVSFRDDRTKTVVFVKKDGCMYAPFQNDDFKELQDLEKAMLKRAEEKFAAANSQT